MSHSLYRWTAVYFTVYLSRPPHCSLLQLNINMDHRLYHKCIWITLKQTATAITEDGQDTALINTPPYLPPCWKVIGFTSIPGTNPNKSGGSGPDEPTPGDAAVSIHLYQQTIAQSRTSTIFQRSLNASSLLVFCLTSPVHQTSTPCNQPTSVIIQPKHRLFISWTPSIMLLMTDLLLYFFLLTSALLLILLITILLKRLSTSFGVMGSAHKWLNSYLSLTTCKWETELCTNSNSNNKCSSIYCCFQYWW